MDTQPAWELTWYTKEDIPSILAANQEEYGSSDLSNVAYLDWFVDKNPNGRPIFVVACETESRRVIGWVIYAPFQLLWRGVVKKILVGFNLLVRKEYRRHGVSMDMIRYAMAEAKKEGYQFMTALANPKSASAHRKMGDPVVSTIPMVVRPLDCAYLTKNVVKNPLLQGSTCLAMRVAFATIYREQRADSGKSVIEVREESEFGAEFETFWEKVKDKYDLIMMRDQAFLQWRFFQMPLRSYRVLSARRNGEILGYVVLRETEIRGIRCGLVSDFMVVPGKAGDLAGLLLMNAATRAFKETKVQLGGGLMMTHTQEYRIMRRAGYVQSPEKFAPQAITLVLHYLLEEIPLEEILRPESWFISNADHDAV